MAFTTRMSIAVGKHFLPHSYRPVTGPVIGLGWQCLAPGYSLVSRIRGNTKRGISQSTASLDMSPLVPDREPLTTVSHLNGIRKIVMCSNKTRNSLSLEMMENLLQSITSNQDDPKLRCILLYGEGQVFSAGHNLKDLGTKGGPDYHHEVFATCTRLMLSIVQCPVPVIAVVHGLAAAAGCQLVATCDIAICSDTSSFSTPGASFGIFCSTPGIAVGRAVPKKVAAHMLFTGLPLTAEEALRAGLVSKVVAVEDLEEEVKKIVDAICGKSRPVIELGKKFLYTQLETDLRTAYQLGEDVMVNNLALPDGQEGLRSFIDKRKANWSHSYEKLH